MNKRLQQKNKAGHNIGSDYVGGDKNINALIGNIPGSHNITNINISSTARYTLNEKDEAKFKDFVPDNKIAEFKNLIERIEFLSELGAYEEAKGFVEEANRIYHNHPVLLTLNGLCEYGALDKLEVIKYPELMNRISKLFVKTREIDPELADFYGWNSWISNHFYEILVKNIESIKGQSTKFHVVHRNIDYYKAIAKHIIHFENCYRINEETFYLKELALHLCGYKDYPWFDIDSTKTVVDLGKGIFNGGAEKRLNDVVRLIQKYEPNYNPPDIKYGDYFSSPKPKDELNRQGQKTMILFFTLLIIATVIIHNAFSSWNTLFYFKLAILLSLICVWVVSHPFGNKASFLQQLAKWIETRL